MSTNIHKTGVTRRRDYSAGVSESIGFILLFSIVMAGIGLVTLYGYPLLLEQQRNTDIQIMENNMIVLQNDIKSLAFKTVPYTETSMRISSGTLAVYNRSYQYPSTSIVIRDCGGSPTYLSQYNPGELRYESISGDRDISLQTGAVIERNYIEGGSAMIAEPRWFYDQITNTMVINLISINSTRLSRSGIGTVGMKYGELAQTNFTQFKFVAGTDPNVCLELTPNSTYDYSLAWDTYVQGQPSPNMIRQAGGLPNNHVMVKYKLPIKSVATIPATLVIRQTDVTVSSL